MKRNHLKKWEIALLLALCVTFGWGAIFGETSCCAWWGTVYPELTRSTGGSAEVFAAADAVGVTLRSQLWDWLAERVLPRFTPKPRAIPWP